MAMTYIAKKIPLRILLKKSDFSQKKKKDPQITKKRRKKFPPFRIIVYKDMTQKENGLRGRRK